MNVPPEQTEAPSPWPLRVMLWGLYAACALLFTGLYVKTTGVYAATNLTLLTHFHAWVPFQYRLLLPVIVNGLARVLPVKLAYLYDLLTLGFTFGLFLVFARFLRFFLPPGFSKLATLGLMYPMLWNYGILGRYYYPPDVPSVFFFVAGLVCLLERRWAWYYPVFVLATLNRETSIFLTLAYLFTSLGRESLRRMAPHLLIQLVIWGAIKIVLKHVFAHNPGELMENHLAGNLALFSGHQSLSQTRHGLKVVIICGMVWLLIPFAWRQQPLFLKRLLWVTVPFLLGMSVVGVLNESRLYNELIPILTAPALFSLYTRVAGSSARQPSAPDAEGIGVSPSTSS